MDYLRLLAGSAGVALLGVYLFVGVIPASEALYNLGLWPARTLSEIQESVSHSFPKDAVVCRSGENGWDYVCDMVRSQAPLPPLRRKFGIACGAYQPVRYSMEMRADEPTRPRPDERRISFHISPLLVMLLFGAFVTARVRRELGGGEISTRRMARLLARPDSHEP
jgi:hypothetical protein